jgi:hypothetical protein
VVLPGVAPKSDKKDANGKDDPPQGALHGEGRQGRPSAPSATARRSAPNAASPRRAGGTGPTRRCATRASWEPRYVSAGPTFVFLHPTFHLIAPLRAGWRRLRLPRVRLRGRLQLAPRQGLPALPRRPDGEAGTSRSARSARRRRYVLTVHVLSDPITDFAFPLSPRARTRNASASGARTRTSSPGASPSSRRTPSPTRACRCAGRAPALRYASTHLRFTPPYFPPLTLLTSRSRNGSGTNARCAANATRTAG